MLKNGNEMRYESSGLPIETHFISSDQARCQQRSLAAATEVLHGSPGVVLSVKKSKQIVRSPPHQNKSFATFVHAIWCIEKNQVPHRMPLLLPFLPPIRQIAEPTTRGI